MLKIIVKTQLIFLVAATMCPYDTYEQGLINNTNPLQEYLINFQILDEKQGDSIGFGFWNFCIPVWSVKQLLIVDEPFDIQSAEVGLFLFLLKSESLKSNQILYFVNFDSGQNSIAHQILLDDGQSNTFNTQRHFNPQNYEGLWIFTYFTLLYSQQLMIIEMTNQNSELIPFYLPYGIYKLIIGGRGLIQISQQFYNLNNYKGRLSKLIYETNYFYNQNHFIEISQFCSIPQKYVGEQKIYLVNGLDQYDGMQISLKEIDEYGNKYVISGWVKCELSNIIDYSYFTLIRISVYKDLLSRILIGDEILIITYTIFQFDHSLAQIVIQTDQYNIPLQKDWEMANLVQNPIISSDLPYLLYDAIQQWHYFQYEYGRIDKGKSIFQVKFKDSQLLQYNYIDENHGSFTNTMFYIMIGGNTDFSDKFNGYLFDIQISYNYLQDKQFLLDCHYSCSQCYGPLKNNCISCFENSNRQYLSEINTCECFDNYLDIQNEEQCKSFIQIFTLIQESEYQDSSLIICPFGYFSLPQNNQYLCIQWYKLFYFSPFQISQRYECIDCLFQPQAWYQETICTRDLIPYSNKLNSAYQLVERAKLEYDFFLIDANFQLQLHYEIQDICDMENINNKCKKTTLLNLQKQIYVICKQNHYFHQGKCFLPDPYCLIIDDYGSCIQCIKNYYLLLNQCKLCPNLCNECYYNEISLKVDCILCNQGWALINGDCIKCGLNCRICMNKFDEIQKVYYLRCYRCINDNLFMLSIDGQNCIDNPITYCLIAFQVLKSDYTINTLDYNFQPQKSDNVITLCAQCSRPNSLFVLPTQTCEISNIVNCLLSVSTILNPTVFDELCLADMIFASQTSIQFKLLCNMFSLNCDTCFQGRQIGFISCLICKAGFYSQISSGICQACPPQLNCQQCYQQNKIIQDYWKLDAAAFYTYFINWDYKHTFSVHAQSQNMDDYEIICQSCRSGYQLNENKCILACPNNCLECQLINGQNICIKCPQNQFGRQLSLHNHQCIQCSQYCSLCRVRTLQEIQIINPLFQSEQFIHFSNQCLKPYENLDIQLYYDQFLGQYIECQKSINNCQRKMTIEINLYCSQSEYNYDYNNQQSDYEKTQFQQRNIQIDDLFSDSNSNFNQFEIYNFYINANQKTIKTIEIKIIIQKQQICKIKGNKTLTQLFSKNIFSAINIQLQIIARQSTSFLIEQSIQFTNFQSIYIEGISFISLKNTKSKYIKFYSNFSLTLYFQDCKFEQINTQFDYFQLIIQNTVNFTIINCEIKNLNQINQGSFIYITNSTIKTLIINNLIISNNFFSNTYLLLLNTSESMQIQLNDIKVISCQFTNSKLLVFERDNIQYESSLQLSNLQIESQISTINGFLDLSQFPFSIINNVHIINSNFFDTNLILIANNVQLNQLTVLNCVLIKSNILTNLKNNILNQLILNFTIINLASNQYDEKSKFILINQYKKNYQQLLINNLNLINNSIIGLSDENLINDFTRGLISLKVNNVDIKNLNIERGIGLPELSFINIDTLKIENVEITQNINYKFYGVHQYVDCVLKLLKSKYYTPSIYIFSSNNIVLRNFRITEIYLINYPLISVILPDITLKYEKQNILIQNGIIERNFLMTESLLNSISLFNIQSKSQIAIKFENLTFIGNVFHKYIQSELINSAGLILVNCIKCEVNLINSIFDSNLVINSTESIMNFKVQSILIDRCSFLNNNQFIYTIIQPFLLWGFQSDQIIYEEQLEKIFQIISLSGNGLIQSEITIINNCSVYNYSGQQGGAFKIVTQNNANFQCINTNFDSIKTFFRKGIESGGVFNIDCSFSTLSVIKIQNIKVSNVFCRLTGGLLYLLSGKGITKVELLNIQMKNVYAKLGSIIYCQFQSVSIQEQTLSINKLTVQNDMKQQALYLSLFTDLQQHDINELLYQRTLIYVLFGSSLILQNLKIIHLFNEGIIESSSVQKVIIKSIEMMDCVHPSFLIRIQPPASFNTIKITGLRFSKIRQQQLINIFDQCKFGDDQFEQIQFQCLDNEKYHQINRKYQQIDRESSFFICLINDNILSHNNNNQAGILSIFDLHQINFIQIQENYFDQIDCKDCNFGIIYINYQTDFELLHKTLIKNIIINNSSCGLGSCFTINKGLTQSIRLLDELKKSIQISQHQIEISEYQCLFNKATYGTCLNVWGFSLYLKNCICKNNIAVQNGGALLAQTDNLNIIDSFIFQNKADKGGGILTYTNIQADYKKQRTFINNNVAISYGNNTAQLPNSLTMSLNKIFNNNLNKYLIQKTDDIFIEGINNSNYIINLPSGSQISKYYYFDWKKQIYQYPKLSLRFIALDYFKEVQQNLLNSFCQIQSRLFNKTENNENQSFTNNLTNIQKIYFDNITQTFNLDELILYFDYEQPHQIILQLQIWCNSVQVLLFNQQPPFNLLKSHNNYYLRLNIRTFPCTFGEIKNITDQSCYICDSTLDLFSLTINAIKCQVKDQVTTISVKSAQLEVRPFYWRPYFDTSHISYCLNLPQNCLGDWKPDYFSCIIGHIGALCEQCDINDIRGDGKFGFSQKYLCGRCSENSTNLSIMITTTIWAFISLILSVKSSLNIIEKQSKYIQSKILKFVVIYQFDSAGVLIKLFTNYLQIIATLTTFQLNISVSVNNILNIFGNPIQAISYSWDCILQSLSNIQIHYARMLWQLLLPFIFLALFFILYVISIQIKIIKFNISVITTAFLYLLIYFQPNLINGLIQLISFRQISGYKWIQNNVAFRYDTEIHIKWIYQMCLPLLIIIGFLIPFFIFIMLYFNRYNLNNIRIRMKWGYLYNEYKIDSYFWEIIKIIEKNLIIIALVYYEDDVVIKGTLVIFIVQIYQELNQYFKPYSLQQLVRIDLLTSNVCQITFTLGVGIYMSNQNHISELPTLFFILIAFINIYFFIYLLIKIILTYFREIQQNIDCIRAIISKNISNNLKTKFINKLLESRIEKKNKILNNFKKIKNYLIPKARQIIKLKQQKAYPVKGLRMHYTNSEQRMIISNQRVKILSNNSKMSQQQLKII